MTAPLTFQARELDARGFSSGRIAELLNVDQTEVVRLLGTVDVAAEPGPEPPATLPAKPTAETADEARLRLLAQAHRDYQVREEERRQRAANPTYRSSWLGGAR